MPNTQYINQLRFLFFVGLFKNTPLKKTPLLSPHMPVAPLPKPHRGRFLSSLPRKRLREGPDTRALSPPTLLFVQEVLNIYSLFLQSFVGDISAMFNYSIIPRYTY